MEKISSGFVVCSSDGKVLLGRCTKYPKQKCWTVFKGQQRHGETKMETALRELKEESGIDVVVDDKLNTNTSSSPFYTFGLKDKVVYIYLLHDVEGVLNNAEFSCASSTVEGNPEIVDHRWFNFAEAQANIFPSQSGLIRKLKDLQMIS